jgi:plasmid stabilization system protein ParE
MRKVRLSGNARAFLQREANYLRERSPAAAEAFLAKLREVRRNLARFPQIGRRKEALPITGVMRLVVGDYILDYDLVADGVAITSIRHARQMDPDVEYDADFDFETERDDSSAAKPKSS